MQISPLAQAGLTVGAVSTGDGAQQPAAPNIRSLKMRTKATPESIEPPLSNELTIPDPVNDPALAATEEAQPLSPQLAMLARQRRALQVKERAVADRERALAEKTASQAGSIDLTRLKSDPLGVMLEAGVTYDQLTEAVLANQGHMSPEIAALKAEIRSLREGVDKTLTDRDARAEQEALSEMRKEASLLSSGGEDFALVRETKSVPQVMKLIERTYRETGEVLDVREALQLVESELITEGLKLANYKKVQERLAPTQALQPPQLQRQVRTLTNRDTASIPQDRKQRALAAFYGTLKK